MANNIVNSVYFTLYQFIKNTILPTTYAVQFAPIETLEQGTTAVFLRGGVPTNRALNGKYLNKSANLTFNIQGFKGGTGTSQGYKYCEEVVANLEQISNLEYTYDGIKIVITSIDVIGDVNYIAGNSQGIPTFSINAVIRYNKI